MINISRINDDNLDKPIWRYMDFWKFEKIIEDDGKLFFTRADKFKDPLEGELGASTLEKLEKDFREEHGEVFLRNWKYLNYDKSDYIKAVKRNSLISCWHINDMENVDMWCSYTTSDESIVIKSTIKKLYNSLKISTNHNFNIDIGQVNYIDFYKELIQYKHILNPLFYKDKKYSFESELRVIVWRRPENNILNTNFSNFDVEVGGSLKIKLNELIDDIYISPNANKSFIKKIENIKSKIFEKKVK